MDYNLVGKSYSDALRYARIDDERVLNSYKNYLMEGKENPRVAKIIANDSIDRFTKYYNDQIDDAIKLDGIKGALKHSKKTAMAVMKLAKLPASNNEIKALSEEFETNMRNLYPKTNMRSRLIISFDRITMGSVSNKHKLPKLGFLKKFLLKYV